MMERMGGPGYGIRVETAKYSDGRVAHYWQLVRFGRELARGVADTEKEARKEASAAFVALSKVANVSAEQRKQARKGLRDMAMKRPFMVQYVYGAILDGLGEADMMGDAEDGEKFHWNKCPAKYRTPLPTHHLALRPPDAARKALKLFIDGGLVVPDAENGGWHVKGARAWMRKMMLDINQEPEDE